MINAFRHQRFLHRGVGDTVRIPMLCDQRLSASKIFAPYSGFCSIASLICDQRLSASKIFARQIKPVFKGKARSDQRLSASKIFARNWNCSGGTRLKGDQRLSASKIFAQKKQAPFKLFKGDQRLSASKIFALYPNLSIVVVGTVINAFRHQRFLHPRIS